MAAPILLVYDAEAPSCRRIADWIQDRDRSGLVVAFPYQNGELVQVAPELAGLDFKGRILTLDTSSRAVRLGPEALPGLLQRLPAWAWLGWLARSRGFARVVFALLGR